MEYQEMKREAEWFSQGLIRQNKGESASITNNIYISTYTVNGSQLFSIRLNEMSNRVNDVDFVTTMFLVNELCSASYHSTISGLKLRQGSFEIHWPGRLNIGRVFNTFTRENEKANSDLQKSLVMSLCEEWVERYSGGLQ